MSETEDLKKATLESKARQQVDAISMYLDTLIETRDECFERSKGSTVVYLVAWMAWVISAFFDDNAYRTMEMTFIFALVYDGYRIANLRYATGELSGALEVLRLLGMLPPSGGGGDRKKRQTWKEGIEMVKGWAITKQKAKDTAYAPA